MAGSILGNAVRRVEDPELLTGQGTFVDNLRLEGRTHAVFVRTPYAHARVTRVDTTEAEGAEGVVAVLTSEQLGSEPMPAFFEVNAACGRPSLAHGKVRFVGEPVALVVAETRAQAVDAAELVDVDYEPLGVVADMESALEEGAPLQFEELGSNVAVSRHSGDDDPLAGAARVVRVRMENQRIATAPIEGHAILAQPTDDGLTVWV